MPRPRARIRYKEHSVSVYDDVPGRASAVALGVKIYVEQKLSVRDAAAEATRKRGVEVTRTSLGRTLSRMGLRRSLVEAGQLVIERETPELASKKSLALSMYRAKKSGNSIAIELGLPATTVDSWVSQWERDGKVSRRGKAAAQITRRDRDCPFPLRDVFNAVVEHASFAKAARALTDRARREHGQGLVGVAYVRSRWFGPGNPYAVDGEAPTIWEMRRRKVEWKNTSDELKRV